MDKILVSIGVLAAFAAAFFAFNSFIYHEKQGVGPAATPQDATYVIDGRVITLVNGVSETEAAPLAGQAGSALKVVTRWFGNEVVADLDGDGTLDTAGLLTQEGGGSGTFFYVVAALKKSAGYEGSQAYFLGDRIAPQATEMSQNPKHERVLVVNYADRAEGEPMTTPPSVGKSVWLKYDADNNQFGIVVQNFEGESAQVSATPQPATSKTPSFTLAVVAAHASASSCYAAIDGSVYDLTEWIDEHPGGPGKILGICGTDATEKFGNQHENDPRAAEALSMFKIGVLK